MTKTLNLSRPYLIRECKKHLAAARAWRFVGITTPHGRWAYHACCHYAAEYRKALAGHYGPVVG